MFQKDGSSTLGGKKDAPLRKSDRRKLRDRVVEALFVGGWNQSHNVGNNNRSNSNDGSGKGKASAKKGKKGPNGNESSCSDPQQQGGRQGDDETTPEWIQRGEKMIDDAFLAPRGGDLLLRKLKLHSGEFATLFLRTPSPPDSSSPQAPEIPPPVKNLNEFSTFPIAWPYHRSAQPLLLEMEDADRKTHLIPLLSLLVCLPPPLSSPPLRPPSLQSPTEPSSDSLNSASTERAYNHSRRYRIPNIVIHAEVSKYLCRGADLMKSGIRSFPSAYELRLSKGLVTVSVIGNPMPCAIGFVNKDLLKSYSANGAGKGGRFGNEGASLLVGPGKKGVGVTIVSCYGDDLWKTSLVPGSGALATGNNGGGKGSSGVINPLGGGDYDNGNFGNLGFVDGKYVLPIIEQRDEEDEEENEGATKNDMDVSADGVENLKLSEQPIGGQIPLDKEPKATTEPNQCKSLKENVANSPTDSNGTGNQNIDEIASDEDTQQPNHDEILSAAFFSSLLYLLSSKTPLPIPVSTYFAKHLMSSVPPSGPRLEMKKTTHGKIGSFLLEMQARGVIQLGVSKDGKDKSAFLAGIVKNHPELQEFKRQLKRELGADAAAVINSGSQQQAKKMAVVELYIVPRHIADGMKLEKEAVMAMEAKTEERRGTGFLTKAECRNLIEKYIETQELVDPNNRGSVLVDGPICDALYKVSKKDKRQPQSHMAQSQGSSYPTSVKRKDLIDRWMQRMDTGHALVEMPGSRVLHLGRGEPVPVAIEVEFRQGNKKKFLTRLRGMEEYGVDAELLSNDVSHRFACSSTIETNPVGRPALKKGRAELVFQGHLAEELTALLTGDEKLTSHGGVKGAEYCLPKSVIKINLRKGVPARKKR